ncbi:hypothetical protein B0I35DRAFT_77099 [Stachybotrys elegans]|uniref:Uncharacterized protein n=1 Tax=Stachybotrys elegans TaxID=80388 RepID=A0A8K0SL01_9HYPO|nr:hypothetical protein B0I35DRAFT_77099 [Stachybotrys elegans]
MNIANIAHHMARPSYHLTHHLHIDPGSRGHLALGTILQDIRQCTPLPRNEPKPAPIPPNLCYGNEKEGVRYSIWDSSSAGASMLAKAMRYLSFNAGHIKEITEVDVFNIDTIQTRYFFPTDEYIRERLRVPGVKDYFSGAPVYMITGLKVARGLTATSSSHHGLDGEAGGNLAITEGSHGAALGTQVGISSTMGQHSEFSEPADLILGIQVLKIQKSWRDPDEFTKEQVTDGARLHSHDKQAPAMEDVPFSLPELNEEDLQGLETWDVAIGEGEFEVWLLPSHMSETA